jgi:predicted nucleic acid-binding protein
MESLTFETLPAGALLLVDTAPIVYFLEAHPKVAKLFRPLFERHAAGELLADAVQAASATAVNADTLITYDRDFSRLHSLRVLP